MRSRVSSAAWPGVSSISENTWPKPPMPAPTTATASRPKARNISVCSVFTQAVPRMPPKNT